MLGHGTHERNRSANIVVYTTVWIEVRDEFFWLRTCDRKHARNPHAALPAFLASTHHDSGKECCRDASAIMIPPPHEVHPTPLIRTDSDPYHTVQVHLEEYAQDAIETRRRLEDKILDARRGAELAEREAHVLANQATAMASLGELD